MILKSKYVFIVVLLIFVVPCKVMFAQQIYASKNVCVSANAVPTLPASGQVQCEELPTFFDKDLSSVAWQWDFGDGILANSRNPSHAYLAAGPKNVTLLRTYANGTTSNSSVAVNVGTYPDQPKFNDKIEADTTVCDGKTLKLNPFKGSFGGSNYNYLWFPGGETTESLEVDTTGCYSVEVFDKNTGCSRRATIKVKFCLQESDGGDAIEKWFLNDGSIMQFLTKQGEPIKTDSLASDGEVFNTEAFLPGDKVAQVIPQKHTLKSQGATASVYDPLKKLTFYSDGDKVYSGIDYSEIKLADGSDFSGLSGGSSNAVFIVPKSTCIECPHHQYYLFSVNPATQLLSYSILDMRYNGKKGAIVEANIPVVYPATQQMEVSKNADETGFVLYTHEPNSSNFSITTVDSNGVNTTKQQLGVVQTAGSNAQNYFSISTDRRKLAQAVVINNSNFIEIFDLDPITNQLSNPILIDLNIPSPPTVYGLAFSTTSDFLYVSIQGDPALGLASSLIQLPLLLNNPALIGAQKSVIATSTTEKYGALQLGPIDGVGEKFVFLSIEGKNYLPSIQNPDVRADQATVNANAVLLGYTVVTNPVEKGVTLNGNNGLGLSEVVQAKDMSEGEGVSANYSGNCFKSPTALSTQGVCSPLRNEVTWEFEDGSTKKGTNVSYTFPKLGWNKIKMRVKIFNPSPTAGVINSQIINKQLETECKEKIYEGRIFIKPNPEINLPDKFYICPFDIGGGKKSLEANPTGGNSFFYNWQTSVGTTISIDSIYTFFAPALYKLEVKNNFDCIAEDKVIVLEGCEPLVFVPDVFTPNGDSKNDDFLVQYSYITDYELLIYNRWGEIVFRTENLDIKWDGSLKGRVFANQLYPYIINYKSKYFPERGQLSLKGTVLILR